MKEEGGRLSRAARRLHFMEGVLPLKRSNVRAELLAGIVLAAVCVPQAIGYTAIAGMPVVTGLYAMLIPLALFALFGSSRHLVVGADSASAAIMATGLAAVAIAGSAQYFALASVIALLTGLLLLLARVMRFGFLADFLSRTVVLGLLTGIGIDIAIAQIPPMLGVAGGGHSIIQKIVIIVQNLPQLSVATFIIAALAILGIFAMRRMSWKSLSMLIAVVAAIALSWILDLKAYGVSIIGPIQGGLPQIGMPQIPDISIMQELMPTVLALFVVIIAQSASLSRAYANKHRERVDENVDIMGLSLANIGASISGTFVVNGGASQTEVADNVGARTQLASLMVVGVVILVLLFLTTPLSFLPIAVLSAIVFLIGFGMINVKGLRQVYSKSRPEFGIAAFTVLAIVFVGIGEAVILAIIVSLVYHVRQGYHPKNSLLITDEHSHIVPVSLETLRPMRPGLVIYRFNHGMYYANSELLRTEVMDLVEDVRPKMKWLCIDFSAVPDVDVSSALTLQQIFEEMKEEEVRLAFMQLSPTVAHQLQRYGVTEQVGRDAIYDGIDDLIKDFQTKV